MVGGIAHPPIGRFFTTYIPVPLIVLAEPGGSKMLPIPPFRGTISTTIEMTFLFAINPQRPLSRSLLQCHFCDQRTNFQQPGFFSYRHLSFSNVFVQHVEEVNITCAELQPKKGHRSAWKNEILNVKKKQFKSSFSFIMTLFRSN